VLLCYDLGIDYRAEDHIYQIKPLVYDACKIKTEITLTIAKLFYAASGNLHQTDKDG
jgi:hypothetical protein